MTANPAPASAGGSAQTTAVAGNLLLDYYDLLPRAVAACVPDPWPVTTPGAFTPGYELPELDADVRQFLAVATVSWRLLGDYTAHPIMLLHLNHHPDTNTTKTFASLLI